MEREGERMFNVWTSFFRMKKKKEKKGFDKKTRKEPREEKKFVNVEKEYSEF